MSDSPIPPAGWFVDPEDATQHRYWDGAQWTDHRAPRYQEALPPYGAPASAVSVTAYGAPLVVPETPISVTPLLAAGGLLILAGLGRAVSYFLPYEAFGAVLLFSALEVVGWAGAFVAFVIAGYPSRRTAARTLAIVLVGIYVITGAITLTLSADPYTATSGGLLALIGLFGFLTLGVGIAFSVVAMRSRSVAQRLRVLPLVLFLGLIAFGIVAGGVNAAITAGAPIPWEASVVVPGLSGLAPIGVGVAFLLFGRTPNATTSVTTVDPV